MNTNKTVYIETGQKRGFKRHNRLIAFLLWAIEFEDTNRSFFDHSKRSINGLLMNTETIMAYQHHRRTHRTIYLHNGILLGLIALTLSTACSGKLRIKMAKIFIN